MSLGPNAIASCPSARPLRIPQVLLLLSLFLTTVVPTYVREDVEPYLELRCTCVKTVSEIHPKNIQNLEIINPGAHCSNVEVIATLKNGRKICLNPEAPMIKKIVQKMMKGDGSAA
ncbi:PREDICTED: platelet basic protein [Propithecus coquereli]|uniref:platelet basic protein n=1 Tax=Propithecus coquereli TaxID=379532 RepID=UPI00063F1918|nr:PREDICTED: platelet basic protein [Propithecus coquereli]